MSGKVEIDAEVLQYLTETAVAHGIILQALLHAQQERHPGFAETVLRELDKHLGQRASDLPREGMANIRARVRADLQSAIDASKIP